MHNNGLSADEKLDVYANKFFQICDSCTRAFTCFLGAVYFSSGHRWAAAGEAALCAFQPPSSGLGRSTAWWHEEGESPKPAMVEGRVPSFLSCGVKNYGTPQSSGQSSLSHIISHHLNGFFFGPFSETASNSQAMDIWPSMASKPWRWLLALRPKTCVWASLSWHFASPAVPMVKWLFDLFGHQKWMVE